MITTSLYRVEFDEDTEGTGKKEWLVTLGGKCVFAAHTVSEVESWIRLKEGGFFA